MYETLIIDGTDLATVCSCITSLDGLYNVGMPRGDNLEFPGIDGETHVERPFGTQVIELGLTLAGASTTEFNDGHRVLKRLLKPGQQFTMQRRLSYSTGNEVHEAIGELASGLNMSVSLMRFGRTTVGIKVLEGLWYDPTWQIASCANGTVVNNAGDARTHRMTITMDAGSSITNLDTGHVLSNTADPANGQVTIDVEAMTAQQGGGSIDVSGLIVFNKRFPFQLKPGSQTIGMTSSAATVMYQRAYL